MTMLLDELVDEVLIDTTEDAPDVFPVCSEAPPITDDEPDEESEGEPGSEAESEEDEEDEGAEVPDFPGCGVRG